VVGVVTLVVVVEEVHNSTVVGVVTLVVVVEEGYNFAEILECCNFAVVVAVAAVVVVVHN